jgi:iron complex transport system permease protein
LPGRGGVGSRTLNGGGWPVLVPAPIAIVPILALALAGGPKLNMLELGDDTATAQGVHVEPARPTMIVLAVLLTTATTAIAGPIAFVALVAPQLARRLNRAAGMRLLPAARIGALLLVVQLIFAPVQLPVGVDGTLTVGGAQPGRRVGAEQAVGGQQCAVCIREEQGFSGRQRHRGTG